ncbi:MAG TPA: serine/threonine-protein kinase, partial [Gemmatimonadales bacterium]|nr:serine/threonine-protein kinase [Gemmatimonadales bacterium]
MPQTLAPTDPILLEVEAALAGRYSVERELGRGGMATVYLARDIRLDRLVAIKVLLPELAVRPELRERFLRETRTAASFSHPNIVPVHAVEETPTLLFFVMGFVDGETLTQVVRRHGPLTATAAARLIQEVAWALSYAHGRGVVHRDVKPDNILLERSTGRAMVTDFGIARSFAASGLTQVGEVVGTPHFMSPEQAAGDQLDGRSDLYSLGVASFFAVTGRLPFDGESAQAI